jgi:hypothetical protein
MVTELARRDTARRKEAEVRALDAFSFVLAIRALFHSTLNVTATFYQSDSRLPDYLINRACRPIYPENQTHKSATMAEGGIDRKMEERMEFSTSKEVKVAPTFEAMHLKENLLRGIYAYGYESPSAVQSRAIVQICKGRDTIAQAQSGTGKTATFSISILQVIDTAVRETQGMLSTLMSGCRPSTDFPSTRPVSHS